MLEVCTPKKTSGDTVKYSQW